MSDPLHRMMSPLYRRAPKPFQLMWSDMEGWMTPLAGMFFVAVMLPLALLLAFHLPTLVWLRLGITAYLAVGIAFVLVKLRLRSESGPYWLTVTYLWLLMLTFLLAVLIGRQWNHVVEALGPTLAR